MPAVTLELQDSLGRALGANGPAGLAWQEEFALGEPLGRLLARLVSERPDFGALYDPSTRRLAARIGLTINGRDYQLIGGVTYLLREGDHLTLRSGPVDLGSRDERLP